MLGYIALLLAVISLPFALRGALLGIGASNLRKLVRDAHKQNVARELQAFRSATPQTPPQ